MDAIENIKQQREIAERIEHRGEVFTGSDPEMPDSDALDLAELVLALWRDR